MKILIGADLVPTSSNRDLFVQGDTDSLVGEELLQLLQESDYSIFNLEVPLTNENSPIEKCGPALRADTDTITGIQKLQPDFLTLANNHILDHGAQGLQSTIALLEKSQIAYGGAGKNLSEACKPHIVRIQGISIGIYCCSEHEFSIATQTEPGANPFDPLESLDHIAELKRQCEYVIVLYHGGKEHYRYPAPYMQKVCHKMVEKGADIVICQHSHCIGCEENYQNGKIVYGQGNFLFDGSKSEYWTTSLLIEIELSKQEQVLTNQVTYIPLVKKENTVRLAKDEKKKAIMEDFWSRSSEIKDPDKVAELYLDFAKSMQWIYLNACGGNRARRFMYRVLNKLSKHKFYTWYNHLFYKRRERIILRNYFECEAHRELFLTSLYADCKKQ